VGDDRLKELQDEGLDDRLRQGAAYVGRLWRDGIRCRDSWSGLCSCGDLETAFCRGKKRWIQVLLDRHGLMWPYGLTGREPFAVIEAMTLSMFRASGLTAIADLPGAKSPVKIGPKGAAWDTVRDLGAVEPGEGRDEAIRAVELIGKVFSSAPPTTTPTTNS
jgi:hypothetical protein